MRAVLLDIEGTVSPIAAVRDTLFPYARARIAEWMTRPDVRRAVGDVSVGQLEQWSDTDVKAEPLKTLQGLVWADGFAAGELTATLYDDVPPVLAAWITDGIDVYVFSSGSVLAQRLWFANTQFGDLSGSIRGWFDLSVGPKREAASYRTIAETIGLPPGDITFYSDVAAELDAAATAGLRTVGVSRERDGAPDVGAHERIEQFTEQRVGSDSP